MDTGIITKVITIMMQKTIPKTITLFSIRIYTIIMFLIIWRIKCRQVLLRNYLIDHYLKRLFFYIRKFINLY